MDSRDERSTALLARGSVLPEIHFLVHRRPAGFADCMKVVAKVTGGFRAMPNTVAFLGHSAGPELADHPVGENGLVCSTLQPGQAKGGMLTCLAFK